MAAKCPYCNEQISNLIIQDTISSLPFGSQWKTLMFLCPSCQKILSTQIDPIAIRNEIVNAIRQNRN